MAFSPDNLKIVSGNDNHSIKIWDLCSGQLLNTLIDPQLLKPQSHMDLICSVTFSSDNLKIVSNSHDHKVKIWDAESGQLLNTLVGHTHQILSVAFSNPMTYPIKIKRICQ
jgi:WD40 repeat protein